MHVTPTLHFNGQCEKAIELYKEAFHCKIDCLLHYSDANNQDWDISKMSEEEKNCIYHAEIFIGEQRIMMADEFSLIKNDIPSIFLTITFSTMDEVKKAFHILSKEGTIFYPLQSTTYSSCVGTVIDKFGYRWGLMTEHNHKTDERN